MKKAESPERAQQTDPLVGHRARLKQRICTQAFDTIADYEVLECLLGYSIPRKDVKPLAKQLIAEFGSLGRVLSASPHALQRVKGVKENTIALLRAVRYANLHILKREVLQGSVLNSWDKIIDYYFSRMGRDRIESLHALFLNAQARVIKDDVLQEGTTNFTPIYPREILQRTIDLGAQGIVLIHNHPSGNVNPSKEDIQMTQNLVRICHDVGITLHDHLIISQENFFSFKRMGLLHEPV